MTLRLMVRNRGALFFGYLLPLAFFFMFGQLMRADQGGANQIVGMVLTIGVLGSGFFGATMIAVVNREQNILRRFKVAPIGPAPILVSSLVVSLLNYLPMAALLIILANRVYGMPMPDRLGSLFVFVSLGLLAFCSIGNIVAAVVNSMQEATILGQLFYMPLLMLGGATIPVTLMPNWLQVLTQYLPSTHYNMGLQAIFRGHETIFDNLAPTGALAATVAVGTLLAIKLFRWEKEEKMRPSAKLWLAAVFGPFLLIGAWQTYAKTNVAKMHVLDRNLARSRSWMIRDARLVVGDGTVIEHGSVLIRDGKIAEIYTGAAPEPKSVHAEAVEAAGKTLLPGLIDVRVHLTLPGGISTNGDDYRDIDGNIDRALAAHLFSGVTAVKSDGDPVDVILRHSAVIRSGEKLGAELFAADATAANIERGSLTENLPQEAFTRMKQSGVFYNPAFVGIEASAALASGKTNLIDGSLVQQVAPKPLMEKTRQALASGNPAPRPERAPGVQPEVAKQNLTAAYAAGVALVTGSDSGRPLVFHGPSIHRELQLWVQAGIPAEAALRAATYNAAQLLKASDRIGAIRKGYDATLLLVDGNPLQDISATERISSVFFKGERVNRSNLMEQK
jgi:imidazolonepropionase-like amidohydrolase/ABC-type multidrug transport system permease subunit